ncbi:glyoxalase [Marinomonas primoryensis]|jgi:predicted enzyme related to lactoylglutathione lyase|uniref:Glyoxalase n=1 Tax=Marinomonas primoryensis TaxID=178399 RepID=A0A2Z4PUP0_9GAMM|nr:VOC family protein [Marinomonas primoryensis]AWY01190.1 glyoxalase [Marinomonas primoryensis]QKK80256.1 VOC family protein [Marinomonas primoryensis]|tara:strand:+ start:483 stop:836 length:354 start_codon:yes stop_codon:yes gene_type:complete
MESNKINYVELPARDLALNKVFFSQVFGWGFKDYGPEYAAFENAGLDGGFFQADFCSRPQSGAALVILFSDDLEGALNRVTSAGGTIEQEIFEFPGGRRFHFLDPCGNEWAVWGELS